MSFQRGRPVLANGEVVAGEGCGRFLPTLETRSEPVSI
jgi:hypothetical protein